MNKFIRVTPLRPDAYQDWAVGFGARVYELVDDVEPDTLEDVIRKAQGSVPAGAAPGPADVAYSLCTLVQAGVVRVV